MQRAKKFEVKIEVKCVVCDARQTVKVPVKEQARCHVCGAMTVPALPDKK